MGQDLTPRPPLLVRSLRIAGEGETRHFDAKG
jgi:hypothetical protein